MPKKTPEEELIKMKGLLVALAENYGSLDLCSDCIARNAILEEKTLNAIKNVGPPAQRVDNVLNFEKRTQ